MIYKCGYCGFVGHCYGVPTGRGVSAPFCSNCKMNDELEKIKDNTDNKPIHSDKKHRRCHVCHAVAGEKHKFFCSVGNDVFCP